MQSGLGVGRGVLPYLTCQTFCTVAALEDLQVVGSFLALLGANFSLVQHRFADLGPEMTSATEPIRTIRGTQTRVALMTFHRKLGLTLPPALILVQLLVLLQRGNVMSQEVFRKRDTDIVAAAVAGATHGISVAALLPPAAGEASRRGKLRTMTITTNRTLLITAALIYLKWNDVSFLGCSVSSGSGSAGLCGGGLAEQGVFDGVVVAMVTVLGVTVSSDRCEGQEENPATAAAIRTQTQQQHPLSDLSPKEKP